MFTRSFFLFALSLFIQTVSAQKLKKSDKLIVASLEAHIRYLASDRLEGRRTGTPGERLASDYISQQFKEIGLEPGEPNHQWLQTFEVDDGKQVNSSTHFTINGSILQLDAEYFPFTFSASGKAEGSPAMALQEKGDPWFFDVKDLLEENQNNPHFDLETAIREKAADYA
ncbi:MAG TPA: hypothetical protein VKR32_03780, partial [Puia sp.]|nr:hypothetical protein [Puia sp.]